MKAMSKLHMKKPSKQFKLIPNMLMLGNCVLKRLFHKKEKSRHYFKQPNL